MGKSCIIIGKGPSILKTNCEYVNSFDDVVICNRPVWDGYEKHIPRRADIQYCNNSTPRFSASEIKELGLKKIVSTAVPGEKLIIPSHYDSLEVQYPDFEAGPNNSIVARLRDGKTFWPSTGILAFSSVVLCGKYEKIAMVGFDLLSKGDRTYYFKPEELHSNLNWLFDRGHIKREGFIFNQENGHDHHALEYIMEKVENNSSIFFEFTTTSDVLVGAMKNFKNVFFMENINDY